MRGAFVISGHEALATGMVSGLWIQGDLSHGALWASEIFHSSVIPTTLWCETLENTSFVPELSSGFCSALS